MSKQVFVTKKSFDEPTCTVSFRIKRIVEADKTADATIRSFENSIIRCTTSVESVQVPFSTFRELWNKNKTEATDFGFKLKQKPSDTITITIFLCKYCFDAYGENHLLTDMSTTIIISDISRNDWKEQVVQLKGKKTYIMTFSIDQVKDIDVAEPKPEHPENVDQNLNVEGKDEPSDEPMSRQRRAIVSFARIASGLRSFSKEVGKGVVVEVVKDWTLQMIGRGSENFKDLRKAAEMSDAYFEYSCKVYDIKPHEKLSSNSEIVVSSNGIEDRYAMEFALANLKNDKNFLRGTTTRGKITDYILLAVRKCVMCTPQNEYIAKVKVPLIHCIATQEELIMNRLLKHKRDPSIIGKNQRVLLDGVIPTYINFSLNIRRQ